MGKEFRCNRGPLNDEKKPSNDLRKGSFCLRIRAVLGDTKAKQTVERLNTYKSLRERLDDILRNSFNILADGDYSAKGLAQKGILEWQPLWERIELYCGDDFDKWQELIALGESHPEAVARAITNKVGGADCIKEILNSEIDEAEDPEERSQTYAERLAYLSEGDPKRARVIMDQERAAIYDNLRGIDSDSEKLRYLSRLGDSPIVKENSDRIRQEMKEKEFYRKKHKKSVEAAKEYERKRKAIFESTCSELDKMFEDTNDEGLNERNTDKKMVTALVRLFPFGQRELNEVYEKMRSWFSEEAVKIHSYSPGYPFGMTCKLSASDLLFKADISTWCIKCLPHGSGMEYEMLLERPGKDPIRNKDKIELPWKEITDVDTRDWKLSIFPASKK